MGENKCPSEQATSAAVGWAVSDLNALKFCMRNALQVDSLDCDCHSSLDVESSVHCSVAAFADGFHELIVAESVVEVVVVRHHAATTVGRATAGSSTSPGRSGLLCLAGILRLLGFTALLDVHRADCCDDDR